MGYTDIKIEEWVMSLLLWGHTLNATYSEGRALYQDPCPLMTPYSQINIAQTQALAREKTE